MPTNIFRVIKNRLPVPNMLFENFKGKVDMVIDGGYGNNIPSTILDCTDDEVELTREGLGNLDDYGV